VNIKPKIKISEEAYDKLLSLTNEDSEKKYVKFIYSSKCCGGKVSVNIDDYSEDCIKDNIDNLGILYDHNIVSNVSEITLVYKYCKFLISFKERESLDRGNLVYNSEGEVTHTNKCEKSCGGCKSQCGGCTH